MPFDNTNEIKDYALAPAITPSRSPATTAPASLPMTAAELMATPDHMLAWLRSKDPSEIVAEDMGHPRKCLGRAFLVARGFAEARVYVSVGLVLGDSSFMLCDALRDTIEYLCSAEARTYNVTAAQAIAAIDRAIAAAEA